MENEIITSPETTSENPNELQFILRAVLSGTEDKKDILNDMNTSAVQISKKLHLSEVPTIIEATEIPSTNEQVELSLTFNDGSKIQPEFLGAFLDNFIAETKQSFSLVGGDGNYFTLDTFEPVVCKNNEEGKQCAIVTSIVDQVDKIDGIIETYKTLYTEIAKITGESHANKADHSVNEKVYKLLKLILYSKTADKSLTYYSFLFINNRELFWHFSNILNEATCKQPERLNTLPIPLQNNPPVWKNILPLLENFQELLEKKVLESVFTNALQGLYSYRNYSMNLLVERNSMPDYQATKMREFLSKTNDLFKWRDTTPHARQKVQEILQLKPDLEAFFSNHFQKASDDGFEDLKNTTHDTDIAFLAKWIEATHKIQELQESYAQLAKSKKTLTASLTKISTDAHVIGKLLGSHDLAGALMQNLTQITKKLAYQALSQEAQEEYVRRKQEEQRRHCISILMSILIELDKSENNQEADTKVQNINIVLHQLVQKNTLLEGLSITLKHISETEIIPVVNYKPSTPKGRTTGCYFDLNGKNLETFLEKKEAIDRNPQSDCFIVKGYSFNHMKFPETDEESYFKFLGDTPSPDQIMFEDLPEGIFMNYNNELEGVSNPWIVAPREDQSDQTKIITTHFFDKLDPNRKGVEYESKNLPQKISDYIPIKSNKSGDIFYMNKRPMEFLTVTDIYGRGSGDYHIANAKKIGGGNTALYDSLGKNKDRMWGELLQVQLIQKGSKIGIPMCGYIKKGTFETAGNDTSNPISSIFIYSSNFQGQSSVSFITSTGIWGKDAPLGEITQLSEQLQDIPLNKLTYYDLSAMTNADLLIALNKSNGFVVSHSDHETNRTHYIQCIKGCLVANYNGNIKHSIHGSFSTQGNSLITHFLLETLNESDKKIIVKTQSHDDILSLSLTQYKSIAFL